MSIPSLGDITQALHDSWPVMSPTYNWSEWTKDNAALGQCVPSSLVVQDYFGGDIIRYHVDGYGFNETHYCNVLDDGTVIDTTRSQYIEPVSLTPFPVDLKKKGFTSMRERLLDDVETRQRYEILKERVSAKLA